MQAGAGGQGFWHKGRCRGVLERVRTDDDCCEVTPKLLAVYLGGSAGVARQGCSKFEFCCGLTAPRAAIRQVSSKVLSGRLECGNQPRKKKFRGVQYPTEDEVGGAVVTADLLGGKRKLS